MKWFYVLLSALFSVFNLTDAWFSENLTTTDAVPGDYKTKDPFSMLVPNITVYRLMEDREHVIVTCKTDKPFRNFGFWHFFCKLSLKNEEKHKNMKERICSSDACMFKVTVSPPAFFTCVYECAFNPYGKEKTLYSVTYDYTLSVLDHHEGVSSSYIGFSSFIAVGLFLMITAVIAVNIRSEEPISSISVTNNDHVDA